MYSKPTRGILHLPALANAAMVQVSCSFFARNLGVLHGISQNFCFYLHICINYIVMHITEIRGNFFISSIIKAFNLTVGLANRL